MLAFPLQRWQRVAIAALLTIPLVLVVIPVMPVLLVSAFLPESRRQYVLELLSRIISWAKVMTMTELPTRSEGSLTSESHRRPAQQSRGPAVK